MFTRDICIIIKNDCIKGEEFNDISNMALKYNNTVLQWMMINH